MAAAVLWGRDHLDATAVGVASPADGVAVALTRGLPKRYAHVDPNEDVVAAVVGDGATLLVVADGHNGLESSEVAVRSVLEQVGDAPGPELADDLVGLFGPAHEAVRHATAAPASRHRDSRTTLTLGLLAAGRLWWASLGDSPLIVATPGHGAVVTRDRHRFVGYAVSTQELLAEVDGGSVAVPEDGWVVAASDGFSNFTVRRDPGRAAALELARQRNALDGARALVSHALSAGAGDNVAVAVVQPSTARKAAER